MTRDDFTPEYWQRLVKIYGSVQAAAREVAPRCEHPSNVKLAHISWRSVERWIYKAIRVPSPVNTDGQLSSVPVPPRERVTRRTSASYEVVRRDANGEPTVFKL